MTTPKKKPAGGDQDKPKLLHFKGKTYRLPHSAEEWDLETAEAHERGNMTLAIAGMVGQEAWQQIKAQGAKVKDLKDIADQIAKAYGFESMGESSASTD
ncbi:hypothetical protein EMG21_28445 [Klebsiella pneumoniae]|nr:hypothetical protein EMG21_28445 [Klebsiella pneumoniae]